MKLSLSELHIAEIMAQDTHFYWTWTLTSTQIAIPIDSLQSMQTEIPPGVIRSLGAAHLLLLGEQQPGLSELCSWDWLYKKPMEITFPKPKQTFVNSSLLFILLPVSFLM